MRKSLILAAAAALQLSDKISAVKPRTKASRRKSLHGARVLEQLEKCRGFQVGSYESKLFKRCLYLTQAPMIVFLHDDELDSPIEVGKCHFLFDNESPWAAHCETHPLELWVACDRDSSGDIHPEPEGEFSPEATG